MVGMNTGLEGRRRRHDTAVFNPVTLDNGIQVWVQKPSILTDAGGTLVVALKNVGSQLDPKGALGTAHIFEHIPFRGTKRRSSTQAIQEPIEERGGSLNAETEVISTKFMVDGLPAMDFDLGVETVSEMVVHPLMRKKDLEIERSVIGEEYKSSVNDPNNALWWAVKKALFGDHPWGCRTIGDLNVIETITTQELRQFHKDYYHAGNLHIVVGGGFAERDDILEVAAKHFGALPFHEPTAIPNFPLPFGRNGLVSIVEPRCTQENIVMVYPLEDTWDYDLLDFFTDFLGGAITSPLVYELRVKRGLIYQDGICFRWNYPGFRSFGVILQTPVGNYQECQEAYLRVLRDLSVGSIKKYQKNRQYRRQTYFTHTGSACHSAAWEIAYLGQQPMSCWEDEAHEDELTVEDVFKLRDHLLENEPLTCIITT